METEQMRQAGYDLIYLTSCAVHGIKPDGEKTEKMDLELLYKLAQSHVLTATICMALESGGMFETVINGKAAYRPGIPDEAENRAGIERKWKEAKDKAVRKNMLLDAARQEICSFMESSAIWYMPLKGILLKGLYPKPGMRQMADNDILFDADYREVIRDYMKSRGYQVASFGMGNHDVYKKPPVYNFEMHTSLYGGMNKSVFIDYYGDVKERLIPDEGKQYGYHFKEEDFYVYIISHTYKHYDTSGVGIRALLDCYLYVREKGKDLDWQYVETELSKLSLSEFEREVRKLSQKIFAKECCFLTPEELRSSLTEKEAEQLDYFLYSGAYGSLRNRVEKKMEEIKPEHAEVTGRMKWKYLMKRLFPGEEHYRAYAPVVYRHRILVPFYLAYRAFRGIFVKRRMLWREAKLLWKMEKGRKN